MYKALGLILTKTIKANLVQRHEADHADDGLTADRTKLNVADTRSSDIKESRKGHIAG